MIDSDILRKAMAAYSERVGDPELLKIVPFAEAVGLSRGSIGGVLAKNRPLTDKMKVSICKSTNIDLDWFDDPTQPVRFKRPEPKEGEEDPRLLELQEILDRMTPGQYDEWIKFAKWISRREDHQN